MYMGYFLFQKYNETHARELSNFLHELQKFPEKNTSPLRSVCAIK